MAASKLWDDILAQLKLQMTVATFDTWLSNTTASLDGDTLTVYVANEYAKDWISHRLQHTIDRTIERVVGRAIPTTLVIRKSTADAVTTPPPLPEPQRPGEIAVELVEFNPSQRGWVQTANYAIRFWQPYLTGVPFAVWLTLRSFAFYADRDTWPSVQTLSDICTKGNRHAILGRAAYGDRKRTIGALEMLEIHRVVWTKRYGEGRNTSYRFRVLNTLPLLTPVQVDKLSPRLQQSHDRFVRSCEIDFEEWSQLTLPTLADISESE